MANLVPCPALDCCDPDPFGYSITSGRTYQNNEGSFIFDCPPGFICNKNVYPVTILVNRGDIPWQPPPYNPFDPAPAVLRFPGCQSEIVVEVPVGSSQADYDAIVNGILAQATAQEAGCRERRYRQQVAKKVFYNSQITASCPTGQLLTNVSATLPKGITISGSSLVLAASRFASKQSQADADSQANVYLTQYFNAALADGSLACSIWEIQWQQRQDMVPNPVSCAHCPWPADYLAQVVAQTGQDCETGFVSTNRLCNNLGSDLYPWAFGAGTPQSPGSSFTYLPDGGLRVILNGSAGLAPTLYLRKRVDGGPIGKHVSLTFNWTHHHAPGFSHLWIGAADDPVSTDIFSGNGFSNVLDQELTGSGVSTIAFDVPANIIAFICVVLTCTNTFGFNDQVDMHYTIT